MTEAATPLPARGSDDGYCSTHPEEGHQNISYSVNAPPLQRIEICISCGRVQQEKIQKVIAELQRVDAPPEPRRVYESHGVQDQTKPENDWFRSRACKAGEHYMFSVKVPSPKVPYVEVCAHCGFIDASGLEWFADSAIKNALSGRAQRIAIATETEPFSFVLRPGEELELSEALGQALGAASTCWIGGTGDLEFDSARAKAIWEALSREIERLMRIDREVAATRAVAYIRTRFSEYEHRAIRRVIEGKQ